MNDHGRAYRMLNTLAAMAVVALLILGMTSR